MKFHYRNSSNGGVDTTVVDSRQHKIGQMANILPLLSSSVFDLQKQVVPEIKSQIMRHTLMNSSKKYADP